MAQQNTLVSNVLRKLQWREEAHSSHLPIRNKKPLQFKLFPTKRTNIEPPTSYRLRRDPQNGCHDQRWRRRFSARYHSGHFAREPEKQMQRRRTTVKEMPFLDTSGQTPPLLLLLLLMIVLVIILMFSCSLLPQRKRETRELSLAVVARSRRRALERPS